MEDVGLLVKWETIIDEIQNDFVKTCTELVEQHFVLQQSSEIIPSHLTIKLDEHLKKINAKIARYIKYLDLSIHNCLYCYELALINPKATVRVFLDNKEGKFQTIDITETGNDHLLKLIMMKAITQMGPKLKDILDSEIARIIQEKREYIRKVCGEAFNIIYDEAEIINLCED